MAWMLLRWLVINEAFSRCTRKYKEAVSNEAGFIDISASNDREQ